MDQVRPPSEPLRADGHEPGVALPGDLRPQPDALRSQRLQGRSGHGHDGPGGLDKVRPARGGLRSGLCHGQGPTAERQPPPPRGHGSARRHGGRPPGLRVHGGSALPGRAPRGVLPGWRAVGIREIDKRTSLPA